MSKKIVESVMQGQPDKVCDFIADALVDSYLSRDPRSQLDLNVFGTRGMIVIGGEVQSKADFDTSELVKALYRSVGYSDEPEVFVNIESPSSEMKPAAPHATDAVIVSGYATRETRERIPRALVFAHNVARRVDDLRKTDPSFGWLQPDGKVQLVMDGDRVHAVTLLASHVADVDPMVVKSTLLEQVLVPVLGTESMQVFINPIGPFSICGFNADSGVNGRFHGIDTYGGLMPHGNQHLSGKDPGKVERAGTYMARFIAKSLVEQELADVVFISMGYTLGREEPIFVQVQGMTKKSRGTKLDLTNLVKEQYDLRPSAIVERLELQRPIYKGLSSYGHIGRVGVPWETVL